MGSGTSAPKADSTNNALNTAQNLSTAKNDPRVQALLQQMGSGKLSLQDALAQAGNIKAGPHVDPNAEKRATLQKQLEATPVNAAFGQAPNGSREYIQQQIDGLKDTSPVQQDTDFSQALREAAYTDPGTGSALASQAVRSDPLTSGLFGAGGIQDQSQSRYGELNQDYGADRNALMGKDESYGLTPTDLAAYGQASGDIARQFGQSGNNLSAMLASQGLSSSNAPSAQAFSGLLGNQNEQLAKSQMTIAQNRIQTARGLANDRMNATLQAQGANNALMGGLGTLGQNAMTNQFNRQLQGSEDAYNQRAGTAGLAMQNQGLQQNVANAAFAQEQATKGPGLGDILGGLASGVAGAAAGGFGSAVGGAAAKGLGIK